LQGTLDTQLRDEQISGTMQRGEASDKRVDINTSAAHVFSRAVPVPVALGWGRVYPHALRLCGRGSGSLNHLDPQLPPQLVPGLAQRL
jgi:hypothetical protein